MNKCFKPRLKTMLAILWFAFTFSLVTWWWIFSMLKNPVAQHMFVWEGSILLAAILLGGVALIVFSYRDQRRHERLSFFFSTFSHDIKTSIARLRLQAEVLEEDLVNSSSPILRQLSHDIRRLDLQLENSLLISNVEVGKLLNEDVSLMGILTGLRNEFTEISLELEKEALLKGDRRALFSVFRNLLHNSIMHGKATHVILKVRTLSSGLLELRIEDNGLGFKGDLSKLGTEILLSSSSRGNGLGLLLMRKLMKKMKGDIHFESQGNTGFCAKILIPGTVTGVST